MTRTGTATLRRELWNDGASIGYGAGNRSQAAFAIATSHQKRLSPGTIEEWAAVRMGIAGIRNRGHSYAMLRNG